MQFERQKSLKQFIAAKLVKLQPPQSQSNMERLHRNKIESIFSDEYLKRNSKSGLSKLIKQTMKD